MQRAIYYGHGRLSQKVPTADPLTHIPGSNTSDGGPCDLLPGWKPVNVGHSDHAGCIRFCTVRCGECAASPCPAIDLLVRERPHLARCGTNCCHRKAKWTVCACALLKDGKRGCAHFKSSLPLLNQAQHTSKSLSKHHNAQVISKPSYLKALRIADFKLGTEQGKLIFGISGAAKAAHSGFALMLGYRWRSLLRACRADANWLQRRGRL